MKPRLRRILDLLLERREFVPVPELAGEIGAGVRTVFRDIQELEFLLRDYGLVIEKRRSVGIRLLGTPSPEIEREWLAAAPRPGGPPRLAGLGSRHRQFATLVYLGHADRVVKLNELATLFFVSDSCVSGDLKELDGYLADRGLSATLDRQRGIGVTLAGSEWAVRMAALHGAAELTHPQELIQHILFDAADGRPARLLATLGFEADRESLLEAITGAESRLGYRFSWNDLALLFLYLAIATRRAALGPAGAGLLLPNLPPSVPESVARRLWLACASGAACAADASGASADETEIRALALFLSALEPGEIRESNRCHPDIDRAVSALLAGLEREKSPLYSFDSRLFHTLRVGLSGLVYKKILQVPRNVPVGAQNGSGELAETLHGILAPILAALYGITVRAEELVSVAMTVRAAEETLAGSRRRFRVLVTCFEGIFLAQFIAALLRAHFPEVTVVSALSCDRATDPWILANAVDLVVTTFPSGLSAAPEYVLSTPFDPASFRAEMADVLAKLGKAEGIREIDAEGAREGEGATGGAAAENAGPDRAIDAALQIMGNFSFVPASEAGPESGRTALIARIACGANTASAAVLQADLDRRERLGAVVLEESGIRLYHCRSRAVSEPRVGVVGPSCFLIAPERAPDETVRALSRVSVALIESVEFTRAIVRGEASAIRRQLFSVLATGL